MDENEESLELIKEIEEKIDGYWMIRSMVVTAQRIFYSNT